MSGEGAGGTSPTSIHRLRQQAHLPTAPGPDFPGEQCAVGAAKQGAEINPLLPGWCLTPAQTPADASIDKGLARLQDPYSPHNHTMPPRAQRALTGQKKAPSTPAVKQSAWSDPSAMALHHL